MSTNLVLSIINYLTILSSIQMLTHLYVKNIFLANILSKFEQFIENLSTKFLNIPRSILEHFILMRDFPKQIFVLDILWQRPEFPLLDMAR